MIAWLVIGLIDTIIKGFLYGWVFIIPMIVAIIVLIIKRKKIKKYSLVIILVLISCLMLLLLTSRIWGPNFYKNIIGFEIDNKENLIERKLEAKYNKNFTFVSKEDIKLEDEYAGNTLGQDINYDYSVLYRFRDDDGVIAIVKYKKNLGLDYYESKRSKYEIEKNIYDYAKEIGLNEEFYVYITTSSQLIDYSDINERPTSNYISAKRGGSRILLIMPKTIENAEEFISNAFKKTVKTSNNSYVHEYIVTEEEYEKVKTYYNSENVKNGIEDVDYEGEYKFDENGLINFRYYYLK